MRLPRFSPRRVTAAAALGVTAVLVGASPAVAAPADAAAWLAGPALTDGNHLFYGTVGGDPNVNYPLYGFTADAVYALAAAGGHADTLAAIDAWLQSQVVAYADPNGTGKYPGPYSGSLAKLALVAETLGEDPHAYGGSDLLGVLKAKTCTKPTKNGKCNAPGEFFQSYVTTSQALGVIALQRSPVAADHLDAGSLPFTRLLALQCTDGLFTGTLLAPGATCTTGDADTTAYAAQALAAVLGADDPLVTRTLTALAGAQDASGGYTGASGLNSNTTGVALSAFSLQPTTFAAAITKGTAFLGTLQDPTTGAYDVSATDTGVDSAKVATPQALLGALGANLVTVVAAPPTTTPPTTTPPTTTAPAPAGGSQAPVVAAGPQLPDTGADHVAVELVAGLGALALGGGALWLGARRRPARRHA